jgi:pimeloyl-ACP methyl ester carboxylesterase
MQHRPDLAQPRPPSKLLLLAEARVFAEVAFGVASAPLLLTAPRGDGHPVLVLPGFMVSDRSTEILRRFLGAVGHDVRGWQLGRNMGGLNRMRGLLLNRLREIRRETGRTVSVVGWSLGGVYARTLALEMPSSVRSVISLGSPVNEHLRANNVGRWYDRISGESIDDHDLGELEALAGDLPVPTTSIYSRSDGVVSWHASIIRESARAENIEVFGASHLGLGVHPAVMWAVADRLAQPEGVFAPFNRKGPFGLTYRTPGAHHH